MATRKRADKGNRSYEYDVCLSFAGADRAYVRRVAGLLRARGVRVFYDEYAEADLWGKDLYAHLDDIYQNAARYCVLFASKHYARRVWTNHERESAQARAIRQNAEYILPARFDSTKIPGLRSTVSYVDLRKTSAEKLASLIISKIGERPRTDYFPPIPDKLFAHSKARSLKAIERVERRARDFVSVLRRMTHDERLVVITLFLNACTVELPDNVHMSLDLLRRITGLSPGKLRRLLGGVGSLGFHVSLYNEDSDPHELARSDQMVSLEWHDMSMDERIGGNSTEEALAVLSVGASGFCAEHGVEALMLLNFSQLATSTRIEEHDGTE
jgi:hypothetical protein